MLALNGQFNIDGACRYGDKSVTHRAMVLAAVAKGKSTIRNAAICRDTLATIRCLRALGASVDVCGTTVTVFGITVPQNGATLNCQNSGTTARLLAGLVCGLGIGAVFTGDDSLSARPMERVLKPLEKMGAKIVRRKGILFEILPSKLHGEEICAEVPSAQVKSAVLVAGLFADGATSYIEPQSTRDHTERMLRFVGANFCGNVVQKSDICGFELDVPNDISSAAFAIVAALVTGREICLNDVCVNPLRCGAVDVLRCAGAEIVLENARIVCNEPVADIVVKKSRLGRLYASADDVVRAVDEIPVLAVAALKTAGRHEFCNVSELRFKECDRVEAICRLAKRCGQRATFDGRNLVIESDGVLPKCVNVTSFGDHRMAMAGVVCALAAGKGSVDDPCFDVSFPSFLDFFGIKPYNFALIGGDVSASKSPLLMRTLAYGANLNVSYTALSLANASDEVMRIINCYDGVNVTMPYKRRVASLTGAAASSVNTVGKAVKPQSTDAFGALQALKNRGIDVANKPLWVVGAGGAAEAVLTELVKFTRKIRVINRTQSRAAELSQRFNLIDTDSPEGILSFVPDCELTDNLDIPACVRFVLVAPYGKNGLAQRAEEMGVTVVSGLEMLYFQGAKSFSLWTGTALNDNYEQFEEALKDENFGA